MELKLRIRPRAVIAVGLAWAVLFVAVSLATRVPAGEVIRGLGTSGTLDYSSLPRFLTPLSETFIERELGRGPTDRPGLSSGRSFTPNPGEIDLVTQRRVARHPFTNDASDNAYPISSVPFTGRTNTQSATRGGDPTDCGSVGGTVWYRYTPPRNMGLIAYTFGTDHAVALGVFERTANAWKSVTPCDTDEAGNALIHFQANRGKTYLFQVTDVVRGGDLRFSLDPQGTITLASVSPRGESANDQTYAFNATPDGRFVAMLSFGSNLVDGKRPNCDNLPLRSYAWFHVGTQTAPCYQGYVYDRLARKLTMVTTSASGEEGNGHTLEVAISGSGRFYAFNSDAYNLGPHDPQGFDLFLKDLRTGAVELIATSAPWAPTDHPESEPSSAEHVEQHIEGNLGRYMPSLSDDGRYVAFQTPNAILPIDKNLNWDVYIYDRLTKHYELATVSSEEVPAEPSVQRDANLDHVVNSWLWVDLTPYISADGRFVVFRSSASNLVTPDNNHTWDTFVRDRVLGTTERVSVSSGGEEGNGGSMGRLDIGTPTITSDGHYVLFDSLATNLARGGPAVPGSSSVYLRDRWTGTTNRIGISAGENQPVVSRYPSISRNGRFITYTVWGPRSDYTSCDPNRFATTCGGDVFVYDMLTDTTLPVTVSPDGGAQLGFTSSVSEDGRIVTFHSIAPDSSITQVYVYEASRAR